MTSILIVLWAVVRSVLALTCLILVLIGGASLLGLLEINYGREILAWYWPILAALGVGTVGAVVDSVIDP